MQTIGGDVIELSAPERSKLEAERLAAAQVLKVSKTTIVTVAGTNGKGSTATLIARAMGQFMPVGLFTSPHLLKFNERIEIKGEPISDEALVAALHQVVKSQFALRDNSSPLAGQVIPLTYFEIVTLAAMALTRPISLMRPSRSLPQLALTI